MNETKQEKPRLSFEELRKIQEKKWKESRTFGERVSDDMAKFLGSWPFIIGQTVFIAIWIVLNILAYIHHWDPYPFILLNLMFSIQAAYSAPILMMSQNRAADHDRAQAASDYRINQEAEGRIVKIQSQLDRIEGALAASGASGDTLDQAEASNVYDVQKKLDRIEALLSEKGGE